MRHCVTGKAELYRTGRRQSRSRASAFQKDYGGKAATAHLLFK
jgi:hypothetical protein